MRRHIGIDVEDLFVAGDTLGPIQPLGLLKHASEGETGRHFAAPVTASLAVLFRDALRWHLLESQQLAIGLGAPVDRRRQDIQLRGNL